MQKQLTVAKNKQFPQPTLAASSAASGCLNLTCCSTKTSALSKSRGMDCQRQSGAYGQGICTASITGHVGTRVGRHVAVGVDNNIIAVSPVYIILGLPSLVIKILSTLFQILELSLVSQNSAKPCLLQILLQSSRIYSHIMFLSFLIFHSLVTTICLPRISLVDFVNVCKVVLKPG